MFDPSKMDPKTVMELSALVQQLPRDQLMRMQTLMHNMMAGFDVRKELEEFEKSLPPEFREKLTALMLKSQLEAARTGTATADREDVVVTGLRKAEQQGSEMTEREARLTVLRGVAEGKITPEEAEAILFSSSETEAAG